MHHVSIGFLPGPEQPAGVPDQQAGSCTQSEYNLPAKHIEPRALVPIPPIYRKFSGWQEWTTAVASSQPWHKGRGLREQLEPAQPEHLVMAA
jgi:hypothetical protein